LKDEACVSETGDLRDMGFLLRFSEDIFSEVLEDTTVRVKIFALHLPFGGFPSGAGGVGAASFDYEEMAGVPWTLGMEKEARSQIDPPSFGGMLHIGVGLYGVMGEMSGSAVETWLEHIKGFHLPCAVFLERGTVDHAPFSFPSHSSHPTESSHSSRR
jgi:hypothetical protein